MAETMHPDTPRNRGDHDAPHESPITPAEDARTIMLNKISWGAVFAGVVVALVTQFILNMLGIGLGAASLEPTAGAGANPAASTFSIGAGIWFALSGILASLAGGYAAGRLAGKPKESTGGWHGLTAWALTTLVVLYLLTHGGRRHPRRCLPHRDERTRQCRPDGWNNSADRGPGGSTRPVRCHRPVLLDRAVDARRHRRQRSRSPA